VEGRRRGVGGRRSGRRGAGGAGQGAGGCGRGIGARRAQVFKDVISGEEFFSTAMVPRPVEELGFVTTKSGVKIPVLVKCETRETTESAAGSLPEADPEDAGGGEEGEEKKLDVFWQYPSIENDHTATLLNNKDLTDKDGSKLTPYKAFLQLYFRGWSKSLIKALNAKYPETHDLHISEEQLKEALSKFADWVKDNRKELQTFGPVAYATEGDDGKASVSSLAYLIWGAEAHVYYFRPAFFGVKY
jgi:hypothetical protein